MVFKLAAVTVGQSPRDDILSEIQGRMRGDVELTQVGVLDGMSEPKLAEMAAIGNEPRLVTRLKDGREVITSKARTGEQLNIILNDLTKKNFDEVVLLCTGYFENVHCDRPFTESQRLVDGYVTAMAHGGRKIGVMVPVAEQMHEAKHHKDYECAKSTYASPYSGDRMREAGRELANMDMIVMHCMGYTSEMRQVVSQSSGCPVVLSRDVVAAGLDHLT